MQKTRATQLTVITPQHDHHSVDFLLSKNYKVCGLASKERYYRCMFLKTYCLSELFYDVGLADNIRLHDGIVMPGAIPLLLAFSANSGKELGWVSQAGLTSLVELIFKSKLEIGSRAL